MSSVSSRASGALAAEIDRATPRGVTPRSDAHRARTPRTAAQRLLTPRATAERMLTPRAATPRAAAESVLTPRAATPRVGAARASTPSALSAAPLHSEEKFPGLQSAADAPADLLYIAEYQHRPSTAAPELPIDPDSQDRITRRLWRARDHVAFSMGRAPDSSFAPQRLKEMEMSCWAPGTDGLGSTTKSTYNPWTLGVNYKDAVLGMHNRRRDRMTEFTEVLRLQSHLIRK
eukprot:TRINITY_DN77217_c0_g1_i1.p1 TRINITY_DN77217_c0_g1~~TRINITY_DN77217_c0_g1_i1.p1  ORF type:complete len:232 (+),score=28.05 TRINITY_DN77217_c0_g1_i1:126-821(+)